MLVPGSPPVEGVPIGTSGDTAAAGAAASLLEWEAASNTRLPVPASGARRVEGGVAFGLPGVCAAAKCPRFLIVDDMHVNRMLLCKMLEALDVEVSKLPFPPFHLRSSLK